jgi:HSP20 family protein
MSTAVYRPTAPLGSLHSNLSRIFDDRFFPAPEAPSYDATEWAPRVDIFEEELNFVVTADIPGVDASAIELTLDKNILTIKGSRNSVSTTEEDGYKRRERFTGDFVRQFTLPETADNNNITAKTNNGVLSVTIPKTAESQPRSIEVISGA